jgi:hypothetical protein
VNPRTCWCCGAAIDDQTAAGPGRQTPEPGDVSVCLYCAAVGIFTEDSVRPPTDVEATELLNDPEVVSVRTAIIELGLRS